MKQTLRSIWPLLFAMFMIMVGNGLQGTLLSLRGETAGFPVAVIGIIMSMYYCGYLGGWYLVPKAVQSVGHIRVFAAFASVASTIILIQGLFVNPWAWGIVRIFGGISFVGLFIIAESWLNDRAPNANRASIFSAYIFIIHAGAFIGQFLINIAPIENIDLFILVSVLVSLSLLPITLANKPSPGFEEAEKMPFKKVVATSPYSVACILTSGFTGTAMLTLGPVFAKLNGMDVSAIALLIALYVLGAGLVPLITGGLSDKFDRRTVIITVSLIALIVCMIAVYFSAMHSVLMVCSFLFGGCVTSIHSIGSALMNDRLAAKQRTSATASLILINGISSCIAPILIGALMQSYGSIVFFISFAICFLLLAAYGVRRAFIGPEIDIDSQTHFRILPQLRISPGIIKLYKS